MYAYTTAETKGAISLNCGNHRTNSHLCIYFRQLLWQLDMVI